MARRLKYTDPNGKCVATGKIGVDLHHIKTRGAGGSDEPWNLIPLSHEIHVEWHQKGMDFMSNRYHNIYYWLMDHGWRLCYIREKWFHDEGKEEGLEAPHGSTSSTQTSLVVFTHET